MPRGDALPGTRVTRLLWFAGLWFGGVVAVGLVAWLIRLLLLP